MFHPMQIGGKRGPKQKVLGLKVGLAHLGVFIFNRYMPHYHFTSLHLFCT